MRIAVLGTGVVGTTLGTGLVRSGHEVRLGTVTFQLLDRLLGALASLGQVEERLLDLGERLSQRGQ